jgi:hypothetical protein
MPSPEINFLMVLEIVNSKSGVQHCRVLIKAISWLAYSCLFTVCPHAAIVGDRIWGEQILYYLFL